MLLMCIEFLNDYNKVFFLPHNTPDTRLTLTSYRDQHWSCALELGINTRFIQITAQAIRIIFCLPNIQVSASTPKLPNLLSLTFPCRPPTTDHNHGGYPSIIYHLQHKQSYFLTYDCIPQIYVFKSPWPWHLRHTSKGQQVSMTFIQAGKSLD